MTYATTNPPVCLTRNMGSSNNMWIYRSTDDAATVNSAGYITNATELGMKVGDLVHIVDTDASPVVGILAVVNSISATYPGAADLQDTSAASTDTD